MDSEETQRKKDLLSLYSLQRRELFQLAAKARTYEQIALGKALDENPFRRKSERLTAQKAAQELALLQVEMQNKLDHMLESRHKTIQIIETLENNREKIVLYLRYFCDMRFVEIAHTLHLCSYTISLAHKSALEQIRLDS